MGKQKPKEVFRIAFQLQKIENTWQEVHECVNLEQATETDKILFFKQDSFDKKETFAWEWPQMHKIYEWVVEKHQHYLLPIFCRVLTSNQENNF